MLDGLLSVVYSTSHKSLLRLYDVSLKESMVSQLTSYVLVCECRAVAFFERFTTETIRFSLKNLLDITYHTRRDPDTDVAGVPGKN